jgi:hypothetical protein
MAGRPGISITGGPGVSDVVAGTGAGGGGELVVGEVLVAGDVLEVVAGDGLAVDAGVGVGVVVCGVATAGSGLGGGGGGAGAAGGWPSFVG